MLTRAEMLARVTTWLEEDRATDDGDPCRELQIERGVSSIPGETWTVFLHDTAAWCSAQDAWEAAHERGDIGAELVPEPETGWWTAWGAGLSLDEALAAALADLDRPDWGLK